MANYTEVKRIVIIHQPRPKAVLLRWLNPLNNWESWLFAGKKQRGIGVENTITYRATDYRTTNIARREGYETMLLRTRVPDKHQAEGIKHLFTSPIVHAVIDGVEQPCTLPELSPTLLDEAVKHGGMEFEITLQRLNTLTN